MSGSTARQLGEHIAEMATGDRSRLIQRIQEVIIDDRKKRSAAKDAEIAALRSALTPSDATEAAYLGFVFPITVQLSPEPNDKFIVAANIPWKTIKEILAAISARAALEMSGGVK